MYNLLSARNVSLNALFEHRPFRSTYSKRTIGGAWIMEAFMVMRRPVDGALLQIAYNVRRASVAQVRLGASRPWEVRAGEPPRVLDGVRLRLVRRSQWVYLLTIRHSRWRVALEASA